MTRRSVAGPFQPVGFFTALIRLRSVAFGIMWWALFHQGRVTPSKFSPALTVSKTTVFPPIFWSILKSLVGPSMSQSLFAALGAGRLDGYLAGVNLGLLVPLEPLVW